MTPKEMTLLARNIIQAYDKKTGAITAPVSVKGDGLLLVISKQIGIPVKDACLSYSGKRIVAQVIRYTDYAYIYYSDALNTCESRFAICKEAVHLLCKTESNHTTSATISDLVSGLVNNAPFGISEEIDIERLAVFGAMELLIPPSLRETLYSLKEDGKSDFQIAREFRVPEEIIRLRLLPHIRHFVDKLNDNVD